MHALSASLIRRFAPLALAFAVSPLAAPAQAAEAPDFKAPAHWAGGWREGGGFTSGDIRVRSFLPAGSTDANWTEALNLTTLTPRPAGPPVQVAANMVEFLQHKAEGGCTGLAQAKEDPLVSADNVFVTQYAQFYCARRQADKVSVVEMQKVVVGKEGVYVFTFMRRAPFFSMQPPSPISFALPADTEAHNKWVGLSDDYLRKMVRVCERGFLGNGACSR